ncbi:MAG: hypothetical protein ACXVEF_40915 [Polyangiales bacterium]
MAVPVLAHEANDDAGRSACMLTIIGLGVFALISIRILQAGFSDTPKVSLIIGIVGVVVGVAFSGWLLSSVSDSTSKKGLGALGL